MKTIRLPGLVDLHVHLRDPGQTHKESFCTGTAAALAGGYTEVFDMPNNVKPITTVARLQEKIRIAKAKIVADVGFYFGSTGDNLSEFPEARKLAVGLKLYLNETTGDCFLHRSKLAEVFWAWDCVRPILLHAEADVVRDALGVVTATRQPTHFCHVSCREELAPILEAKASGLPVTCGVTPHHLFLTDNCLTRLGNFALMKPTLKSRVDQEFLWQHLDQIDVIETDHAPHTCEEKRYPVFGVPGLETALPLLLQAERDGRISLADVVKKCCEMPRKILGLDDSSSYVEVCLAPIEIRNAELKTKCGWSPFSGHAAFGKVRKVVMRNATVYENAKVLAKPGDGCVITSRP